MIEGRPDVADDPDGRTLPKAVSESSIRGTSSHLAMDRGGSAPPARSALQSNAGASVESGHDEHHAPPIERSRGPDLRRRHCLIALSIAHGAGDAVLRRGYRLLTHCSSRSANLAYAQIAP